MLKKSQIELIEFIYAQRSVSSGSIASHLQLSKRTIINYVKEINDFFSGPDLILSNNKGYCLDLDVLARIRAETPELTNFAAEERAPFLAKRLLSSYRDKLNINEVGSQLHFSGSTIRADLYKLRDAARDYGLEIQLDHSSASLIGPELKKREFYFSLFQDTLERNIYDFSQLELFFPQFNCGKVYLRLISCIEEHGERMSDYELINIFYRLLIAMDRIAHGHLMLEPLYLRFVRESTIAMARDVTAEIGPWNGLEFPEHEVMYLALLFAAIDVHSSLPEKAAADTLTENLWPDCYELVEQIVDGIRDIYGVDLRKSSMDYVDFALHVRSLIHRLHGGIQTKNPYRKSLKRENPATFDCAVYAAGVIQARYPLEISEDDIAYLALCLGYSFEREFNDAAKLKALFVLPSYYNVHDSLYRFYSERLSDHIESAVQTSNLEAGGDLDAVDIVVSTLGLKHLNGKRFVQIGPIRNTEDYRRLDLAISDLRHEKMLRNLALLLKDMTDDRRFYHVSGRFPSQGAVLDYMIAPLLEEGIVTEDFQKAVLHREALSSTRMGPVALPRAIGTPAEKDTLSLLVSDVPIRWNREEVWAVLLFTTASGHYHSACLKVLRRLSHVLKHKEVMQRLLKCRSWQDFTDLML